MDDRGTAGGRRQPLSIEFTTTASARRDDPPTEHLHRTVDLARWIVAIGLSDEPPPVDEALLASARDLRETIYRAVRRRVDGDAPRAEDRRRLNDWAASSTAARVLDHDAVARWEVSALSPARSALGVVAADAIEVLGGARDGALKVCAGERCAAVFLDTSRGGTRRWCSMSTCGNRAKKSAMRARGPASGT